MKLLWLDINCSYAHSSLALPAIHAQTLNREKNADITWEIVSGTTSTPMSQIINEVISKQPDIIAATCWLFTIENIIHLTGRIKALLPKCLILLGGPEFLGDNEFFLRINRFVDGVFRGEGEEEVPKWLDIINRKQEWDKIKGVCYLRENGSYHDGGLARVIEFDKLTPPEKSCFFDWSKPFVQLETTRGCFNTCAFCVSGGEKPVRSLPIETVRERISDIHRHGIQNIRILDRTFNYNSERAKEMLKLFASFAPDIRFHLEIHPALLTDEIRNILQSMPEGVLHLEAGIQSLRSDVLKTARRAGSLEKSLAGLKFLCSLSNMETHADLIAGLPGYSYNQIENDVYHLAEIGAREIQLESLKLLPGTVMRKEAEDLGIKYSPFPPYEVLASDSMNGRDLYKSHCLSRLLDGYYNAPAWHQITRDLLKEEPDFLSLFLDYLTKSDVIESPLSVEKRGTLLFSFCRQFFPKWKTKVSLAWIRAGLSLKKEPAGQLFSKEKNIPEKDWIVTKGLYTSHLRLYRLPDTDKNYWFGFDADSQNRFPIFEAELTHRDSNM
ncbi:MAG: DUF4080 domain-containing protein [Bacteroidaceae bacterium]|nr:DUF4080 domain-containing protein [Bacteroidaceae bacterium]